MSAAQKNSLQSRRRFSLGQAGFSLIELMVVVAIIAVLATIAIPRVNRFVAKSRTSEAQINLSSVYTFNKNFYVEYQGYTNSLATMGYIPEGRIRYNVGWSVGLNCPIAYSSTKGACNGITNSATFCGVLTATAGGAAAAGTGPNEACDLIPGPGGAGAAAITGDQISNSAFRAIATARLIDSAANENDVWRINQDKNLDNDNDGTDGI